MVLEAESWKCIVNLFLVCCTCWHSFFLMHCHVMKNLDHMLEICTPACILHVFCAFPSSSLSDLSRLLFLVLH
jgi:hypothetical protein